MNTYVEETVIPLIDGLKDFMKVRLTKNEEVIAVSTKTKELYMVKFTPDTNTQN